MKPSKRISQKPRLTNDFAYLPNEIVHDVIDSGSNDTAFIKALGRCSSISGSWAQFAISARADCALRYNEIGFNYNIDSFKIMAPKLYDIIQFNGFLDIHFNLLELFGTRFSKITWNEQTQSNSPQITNFFQRQLKSKYLRTLTTSVDVEQDLLLDFVKDLSLKV